ncbi:MAG: 16S rRNA (cytidine(1402)-2'-O)-methyltransferase [Propionibacteriaceae bacterium]
MTDGLLILAGTPIGDVKDASTALITALITADVIAAEDTRRLKDLLRRLDITTAARIVSYFDGNEAARVDELLTALNNGARVVVATDAGMPSVSDPGYRITAAAIAAGIRVTAVPGPSAVLTALALSGLPCDRFCFEGFLPRKKGERRTVLAELATEKRTMVWFEAPHRLAELLADAADVLGARRRAAVCRELTKTYEEVRRGTLSELAKWAAAGVRGEISVVVEGFAGAQLSLDGGVTLVAEQVAAGITFKTAVADIAAAHGLVRKELYQAALSARSRQGKPA